MVHDYKKLDFSNMCDIISTADAALAHLVERHLAKVEVADAALAHLVERHLAKVEVASSSLVGRSTKTYCICNRFFYMRVWWNWQTRGI